MKTEIKFGIEEGDTCGRDGCEGIMAYKRDGDCSCHINPPCSSCTGAKLHCPECEWTAPDEALNGFEGRLNPASGYTEWKLRPLDPRKIDYHIKVHTNSSQLCEGVYPAGATREDVEKLTKGTFGGRFDFFAGGHFKYVAYTD